MLKLLPVTLTVFILFFILTGYGQQYVLEVKSFEYIYHGGQVNRASHENIVLGDSIKLRVKNSFAKALEKRWNIVLPEISLSTKPMVSLFSEKPKFKTDLKNPVSGKWYMFLQVYETGTNPNFLNEVDVFTTTLELRSKIISGTNDSVIIDRTLKVSIQVFAPPVDQVPLTRLPAYPESFIQAFDSITTWLFQPVPVSNKILKFRPACIFQKTVIQEKPLNNLSFYCDFNGIHQLKPPVFILKPLSPEYEKTGVKKNVGGRTIGGAFTILTGMSSSKTKYYKYNADHSFKEKDSTYHCLIGYIEAEMAERERVKNNDGSFSTESSDYKFSSRSLDEKSRNAIILGADTLATFNIAEKAEASSLNIYNQMWDGKDSTTIVHLPPVWNNKIAERDIVIAGRMGHDSFTMKTLKGKRIKEFYLNNQLAVIIQGIYEPINATVFLPISSRQLKLFTILSSIPYAFFSFP